MSQPLATHLKLSTPCLSLLNARPASNHGDMERLKKLTAMKKKDLAQELERIFDGRTELNITNWEAVHTWQPEGTVGGALPAKPCAEPDEMHDDDQQDSITAEEEIAA